MDLATRDQLELALRACHREIEELKARCIDWIDLLDHLSKVHVELHRAGQDSEFVKGFSEAERTVVEFVAKHK